MPDSIYFSLKRLLRTLIGLVKSTKMLFNKSHLLKRKDSGGDICTSGSIMLCLKNKLYKIWQELNKYMKELSKWSLIRNLPLENCGYSMQISASDATTLIRPERYTVERSEYVLRRRYLKLTSKWNSTCVN